MGDTKEVMDLIDFTEQVLELDEVFERGFSKPRSLQALEYMAAALMYWADFLSSGPGKGPLKKYQRDVGAIRYIGLALDDLLMAFGGNQKKKWDEAKRNWKKFLKAIEYDF